MMPLQRVATAWGWGAAWGDQGFRLKSEATTAAACAVQHSLTSRTPFGIPVVPEV